MAVSRGYRTDRAGALDMAPPQSILTKQYETCLIRRASMIIDFRTAPFGRPRFWFGIS